MTLVVFGATAAPAQEPLMDTLKNRFQSEPLALGAVVQVIGLYKSEDSAFVNNGFALANFRLSLGGKLDQGWGYFLQASFIKGPAFLDANVRYHRWSAISFDLGAFKAPFSAEFLTSAAGIDFVNRSQVVTLLVPGHQVGIVARGELSIGFGYALAAMNGNGLSISNDDDRLMTVGRVTYTDLFKDGSVALGANAFQSQDTNAPIGVPITGNFIAEGFAGERAGYGADAWVAFRRWLAVAEIVGSRFDPRGGARVKPNCYYVTVGYDTTDNTQVLARWDRFEGAGAVADSDLIVLGLNYWPTSPTGFKSMPSSQLRAAAISRCLSTCRSGSDCAV
jgi:hypothetical protein